MPVHAHEERRVHRAITAHRVAGPVSGPRSPELELYSTSTASDDFLVPNRSTLVDSQRASLFANASSDDGTPPMSYPTAHQFVLERDELAAMTSLYVSGTLVRNRESVKGVEKG